MEKTTTLEIQGGQHLMFTCVLMDYQDMEQHEKLPMGRKEYAKKMQDNIRAILEKLNEGYTLEFKKEQA